MACVVEEGERALKYQDIAEGVQKTVGLSMPLSKGIHINGGFDECTTSDSKDMGEIGVSMENLTEIDLKLEHSSEKLLNLNCLLIDVSSWENDVKAQAFVEKSVTIDLLYSFIDSEVKELDILMDSIQVELVDAHQRLSSCKHHGEMFSIF